MTTPEIRPGLSTAILQTLGRTAENIRTRLGDSLVTFTDEQIEEYRIHGFAVVHLPIHFATSGFIVDIGSLKNVAKPKNAWFIWHSPTILALAISSGKQQAPEKALEFLEDKEPEGLFVTLDLKVSPKSQIPYRPELDAFYSD